MSRIQWRMKSAVGPIYLVASDEGLHGIFWRESGEPFVKSLESDKPAVRILVKTIGQLEEYFAGKRKTFDLPLGAEGTEFQKKVWHQLAGIPYGQTVSYREIARRLKNEKAVRAVGLANGRNPLSIVVPCHRVIASDGTLCGYAGGLDVKAKLLKLEGALLL